MTIRRAARCLRGRCRSGSARIPSAWTVACARRRVFQRLGNRTIGAVNRRCPCAKNGSADTKRSSAAASIFAPPICPTHARTDVHRRPEHLHLRRRHQPCMIVLVAQGQAVALDRIRDEQRQGGRAGRPPRISSKPGKSCPPKFPMSIPNSASLRLSIQARDGALVAEIVHQALAPCSTPLKRQ